jgi:hypothetical protein
MAHFARIEEGVVRQVIVVNNEVLYDENKVEQETIGAQFCADLFGGVWVQTSYNGKIRGKFAGQGDTWNGTEFITPEIAADENPPK